jgi:hypothetical protein
VRGRSRSNLIAAGLLTASIGIAACDDAGDPDPPADAMVMGGMMELDAAPDMMLPVALYGEPPMLDMDVPVIDAEIDAAPEPEPQPEYGAPPEPDAAIDAEIDAAPEPEPQPEYGAPPEVDAGAEMDAARDPGPQPLYGAAPAPEPAE